MFNIAIDGPAGAGKSSIAKAAAAKLKFIYVDTGALYRSIALFALKSDIDPADSKAVIDLLPKIDLSLAFEDGTQKVILNGEDVSEDIRMPEVSSSASKVSAIPEVRAFLFDIQQNLAKENNVLMDGRDIGTVVLPNADLKIFLTASPEERARRRQKQLADKGTIVDFDELLADINKRDYDDSHREIAPLKPAEDAVYLDTTEMTFDEVTEKIYSLAKERM
ncbi:MAG: (d)CMP kinase [Clostridia bacterium]|nr:(d)CMP kinase [Clostridia bacterium]